MTSRIDDGLLPGARAGVRARLRQARAAGGSPKLRDLARRGDARAHACSRSPAAPATGRRSPQPPQGPSSRPISIPAHWRSRAPRGSGAHVRFEQADAYALPDYGMAFDAGMAHFWWSHVSLADQQRFLTHFASKLQAGREAADDGQHASCRTPAGRSRARMRLGNTYQLRTLASGETYEVAQELSHRRRIAGGTRNRLHERRGAATELLLGAQRDARFDSHTPGPRKAHTRYSAPDLSLWMQT